MENKIQDKPEDKSVDSTKPDDKVDEAGKESFPASDPPAWNSGTDNHSRS